MAAPAQPEAQPLQGVSRSGSTWYAHLTITNSLSGSQSKYTVSGLPTRRVAAHARDLLLLAKERLFGLHATKRHDQLHFERSTYEALQPDLRQCSDMQSAASLITRLAERGELSDLARASAAAGLAPQVPSRPPSALLGELEQGQQQQRQLGQRRGLLAATPLCSSQGNSAAGSQLTSG
ncbi:pilus assembly [Chlorella sorokiniana]|uniref:Pilus assembly n=1 Tax=Chlorella sorokiniana TaxID=3076 RepID=A0A2P6TXN6_CHLSO|nr:pilus assembly [Chlorella sorokiniana]|eukprot:PRW58808.1 pilus assembly [Chlorella sorokiniana]